MTYRNDTGLPSVTQILSPYIDSTWFTQESRDRGEAVHAACAAHLMGTFCPPLDPEHQPYFDSARRWIDMAVDLVVLTEERLVDPALRYCGKPDLIAYLKGDKQPTLIDFKTSQAAHPVWPLQITAYRKLAQVKGIGTARGISLRLKADGSGCLPKEYKSMDRYWNVFIGLLNAHHFFNPTGGSS